MEIIIPILICLGIAAVCAIILTVSNILFGVQEDEKFLAIRDALPGANCGACGFSGCDGYARALSEGKISETNLCVPGGDSAAQAIADVLGKEAEDVIEMMLAGATAVEVGAANLVDPFACKKIIEDLPRAMEKYKINNLTDIIGGAH